MLRPPRALLDESSSSSADDKDSPSSQGPVASAGTELDVDEKKVSCSLDWKQTTLYEGNV